MSRGGRGGRGGGYFHGDRGGRGGGFNGRGGVGGYDDWGKRPGEELDGPPSRMRKMDTSRSPDLMEENGRRGGDSNGASAAKTITDLAKRIDKVDTVFPPSSL
jgi:hypothetical protein